MHLVKVNEGSRELGSTRFSTENYWLRRAVGVQLITDNSFGECLMLPRDMNRPQGQNAHSTMSFWHNEEKITPYIAGVMVMWNVTLTDTFIICHN